MKKYNTPALRYLWRHRLFTALNVLGLSISLFRSVSVSVGNEQVAAQLRLPHTDRVAGVRIGGHSGYTVALITVYIQATKAAIANHVKSLRTR